MRIGELSKRSGMSIHSIRWYETQRLIPGVQRDPSGHRDYGQWHVDWLALLARLKLTGMTIAQMASYAALVRAGETTLVEQRDVFVAHRAHAAAEIDERRRALAYIDAKIAFLEQWISTGERPSLDR